VKSIDGDWDGRSENRVSNANTETEHQDGSNTLIDSPMSHGLLESELNLRSVLCTALAAFTTGFEQRPASRGSSMRAELRTAVVTYVSGLQKAGVQSEQVLVRLKGLIHRALPNDLTLTQARFLTEDIVRWSIDAYYGTSDGAPSDGDGRSA
jgi:hypothetical protein